MAEKGILASFNDPAKAEAIASKLKALRSVDVQIDRISRYPEETINDTPYTPTGRINSLATLTQDAAISSIDAGILVSADPAASGLSDGVSGPGGGVTGKDILLTAVVDESIYEQALRVIQDGGGEI
jgi:hypothetical protein